MYLFNFSLKNATNHHIFENRKLSFNKIQDHENLKRKTCKNVLVWPRFEPRTFCVLVGHSTTELRKLNLNWVENLSLYRQWETFPFPFPPILWREFGNFSCVVYTYTKLHVQGKKSLFWIFHWGHDVPISLPLTYVKAYKNT